MAVSLASAFVRIRPEADRAEFRKTGEQMGKEAGDKAGKAFGEEYVRGADGRLRDSRGKFVKAGEQAGDGFGEGYTRGADGRLRDHRGKFVKDFETMGEQGGERAGKGFGKGFAAAAGGESSAFGAALAATAARLTLFGSAAAAAAPGVIQLAAAVAPAAAALAVMPAYLLAVKAASATARVAVMGVGDAITAGFGDDPKAAAEALKELSGSARVFAKQAIELKKPLDDLQNSVSDRFFLPLIDEVRPLATALIPLLKQEMSDLAGTLGGFAEGLAKAGRSGVVMNGIRAVFDSAGQSLVRLRAGIQPVATGLANLVIATGPELPKLAEGFANLATRAGNFISAASQDGRITAAFGRAKQVIADLVGTLVNIGTIVVSVFQAASASGGDLLGNLRALTGQVAAFLQSAQGMAALGAVFGTLGTFGAALKSALGAVLPAIAESLQVIGPAVAGLAGPFSQLVVAVAPLLPIVAGLTAQVVTALTPAIAALAGFLAQNTTAVKVIAVALVAYTAIMKTAAVVTGIQAAGGMLAYLKATTIATGATKLMSAAQLVLGGALRFALGPIGLIITAIGLLVGGIVIAYQKHEGFRNLVQQVWAAIKSAVQAAAGWILNTAVPWLKRAFEAISKAVQFAWQNVIRPAVNALVAYFRTVVIPVVQFLYRNVFQPIFKAIGFVVQAAWVVIQIALKAFQLFLRNVIIPLVRSLYYNTIKPVFDLIGAVIRGVWQNFIRPALGAVRDSFNVTATLIKGLWERVIKPTFKALGSFIGDTVVPAFKTATGAIRVAWEKVKEYAKKPIEFVVRTVVNPFIGGINKVASAVGVKDQIPKITGFASGGQIPGARPPGGRDNQFARVRQTGRLLAVGSKEFITNSASTMANLPLVRAINAKRGKVTREDVDPYLDGGGGDGIGDFFGRIGRGLKGAASFVLNPVDSAKKIANAALAKIPGAGMLAEIAKGVARNTVGSAMKWLDNFGLGGGIGGGGVAGGWRGMQRLIANRFPGLPLISGFRPGAITVTGNPSYHGKGRAVDYPPNRQLAVWIKSTFGKNTKELITPWQDLNLRNGKPRHYTGEVWRTHNFAGGNAHVHWAAQLGGLIGRMSGLPLFSYDSGGLLPTGLSLAHNGTGRPEPVGHDLGGVHVHFHEGAFSGALIGDTKAAEDMVVGGIKRAQRNRRLNLPKGAIA